MSRGPSRACPPEASTPPSSATRPARIPPPPAPFPATAATSAPRPAAGRGRNGAAPTETSPGSRCGCERTAAKPPPSAPRRPPPTPRPTSGGPGRRTATRTDPAFARHLADQPLRLRLQTRDGPENSCPARKKKSSGPSRMAPRLRTASPNRPSPAVAGFGELLERVAVGREEYVLNAVVIRGGRGAPRRLGTAGDHPLPSDDHLTYDVGRPGQCNYNGHN